MTSSTWMRPAASDSEALNVDLAGELDRVHLYHNPQRIQLPRLVGYVVNAFLVVVEVRHG